MERHFGAFIRVQRRLDDLPHLLELFQTFENKPSAINAQDCIRLLDLPPLSTQDENVAAVSTLTKDGLLERAAQSPEKLTRDEICLLQARFWSGVTCTETDAYIDALYALEQVSTEYCEEMIERIQRFQRHLYAKNEAEAIENAAEEDERRDNELSQALKQEDLDFVFEH